MTSHSSDKRVEREVEREQSERLRRDDERIGGQRGDETRHKDARDNALAADLPRARPR